MSSVKVAVRVRPFNNRELALNCQNVVRMIGQKTILTRDPSHFLSKSQTILHKSQSNDEELCKEFTFDKSYWSFDDTDDSNFASQEVVFEDLGKDIVNDAIEGYNSCIFAYGQTGSGKTHTMMGSFDSEGLIPRICRWLFLQMHSLERENSKVKYKTEISYLEIYNEHVRDLIDSLTSNTNPAKKSLKVREHPKHGPYVEGLSKHMVYGYQDILELMKRGNLKRTTAATGMNDSSSRSHAIFTIFFSRATYIEGNPYETISKINLVDLAGSERANSTNSQGVRLVEGSHINKSLVTLGSVISHLAESCKKNINSLDKNPSGKRTFVPYRDSILTWLLKDSLGGNSKSVMIATISPADVNFSETLNTLRYANRAKNILNKPHINEDPNTKLIRELRAEIDRLNSMMKQQVNEQESGKNITGRLKENETKALGEMLIQNEEKVKELTTEWMNKWQDLKTILKEQDYIALRKTGNSGVLLDSDRPHLIVCLDDDVLRTGVKLYHLNVGRTRIGTVHAQIKQDIILNSTDEVEDEHCIIEWDVESGNEVFLCPINSAKCRINSQLIYGKTALHQGCFVAFGDNLFRFSNPHEVKSLKEKNGSQSPFLSFDSPINNLKHRKALFHSFTSSPQLSTGNGCSVIYTDDKQIKRQSLIEDLESTIAESKFEKLCDDLSFVKLFLLELEHSLHHSNGSIANDSLSTLSNSSTSLVESFLEILIKIGKQGQFPKEKILEMLTFINSLDVNSNVNTIQKLCDYLLNKMSSVKTELKEEMHALSQAESENDGQISNTENSVEIRTGMNDSYYKLCELDAEIESGLALLNSCLPMLSSRIDTDNGTEVSTITIMTNSISDESNDSFKIALHSSPIRSLSESSLEEIIENEVQRRVSVHLKEFQHLFTSPCSTPNFVPSINHKDDGGGRSGAGDDDDGDERTDVVASNFGSSITLETTGENNELYLSPSGLLHNGGMNENIVPIEHLNEIFLHIPAFHLVYEPKPHYVYEIRITINDDKWTLFRRYSAFLKLNQFVIQRYSDRIEVPYFPPKRWKNMNEKVLENRRRYLEKYLQQVIDRCRRVNNSPLNYRSMNITQMNRQCLYNFNTFFRISPMSDKNEQKI